MPQAVATAFADDADFLIRESNDEYRKKAREYLTSHALADFRRCPLLFRKKELGLIEEADSPAFLLGRAVHTHVLEGGHVFENQCAVGGPVNPRTGNLYGANTKAYAEWAQAQGKPVLTDAQFRLVTNLSNGVRTHAFAKALLKRGVAEGVVRATYAGVRCQARLDWFSPEHGIVDLKTCDDLTWFEADARRFSYVHQMAFYHAVLKQVTDRSFPIHMIGVEKREPFRCGVWRLHDEALAITRLDNEAAIERLRECRETDTWPTGYEDVRVFDYL